MEYISFDLETTGVNPKEARIVTYEDVARAILVLVYGTDDNYLYDLREEA